MHVYYNFHGDFTDNIASTMHVFPLKPCYYKYNPLRYKSRRHTHSIWRIWIWMSLYYRRVQQKKPIHKRDLRPHFEAAGAFEWECYLAFSNASANVKARTGKIWIWNETHVLKSSKMTMIVIVERARRIIHLVRVCDWWLCASVAHRQKTTMGQWGALLSERTIIISHVYELSGTLNNVLFIRGDNGNRCLGTRIEMMIGSGSVQGKRPMCKNCHWNHRSIRPHEVSNDSTTQTTMWHDFDLY